MNRRADRFLRVEPLEPRRLLDGAGPLFITEFMADNDTVLADEEGDFEDWIEIGNPADPGSPPISLGGWYLTDDNQDPTKWQIPDVSLAGGEYLVVFASNKNRSNPAGTLHTNFKLGADGEYLALVKPDLTIAYEYAPSFPPQSADVSYGLAGVALTEEFFATPTPGAPNDAEPVDHVSGLQFTAGRGFYSDPFDLQITTETAGATLVYTTNGSEPTLDNLSAIQITPAVDTDPPLATISINATTTLRATAYKTDWQPTDVETHTYVFLDDVVNQTDTPHGWPGFSFTGQVLDYGMDPDIVNDAAWGPQLVAALSQVPSLSLVIDLNDLFHLATGIYVNPDQRGSEWERPTSFELIHPDGTEGFQIDAGLRIRGDADRDKSNPKHSFRLFFREQYGEAELTYPLFGDEGASEFDKIDLRTSQDYSWAYQGNADHTFVRDVYSRDTQGDLGQPYSRSRYYHLYINGVYWGLYQTQERTEAAYGATYFDGTRDQFDVLKSTGSEGDYSIEATDGDDLAWRALWDLASAGFGGTAGADRFQQAQGLNPDGTRNPAYPVLLDVDNLIDYMIVILYSGNSEGPISESEDDAKIKDWFGVRNRDGDEGFRFFVHNAEHTLNVATSGLNKDRTGPWLAGDTYQYSNPQWLHQQLMAHAEYRIQFGDRVHELLFNDGPLAADAAVERYLQRANEIDLAIIAESARWGDAHIQVTSPLTKDDWLTAVNDDAQNYLPARPAVVVSQLRAADLANGTAAPLYPSVDAPAFNQHGGVVAEGFALSISATAGTIYYTTDGSDPRLIGGGLNANAVEYLGGPLVLNDTTTFNARVLDGGEWSALNAATFYVGDTAASDNLAVAEINYNPRDPTTAELEADSTLNSDSFEFVELVNYGGSRVDLTDLRFSDGIEFTFPFGSHLQPGQRLVIVSDPTAFEIRYGAGVNVAGQFTGSLDNGGENLALINRLSEVIHDFSYDDESGWPWRPDGSGSTLEIIDPAGGHADPGNWRPSAEYGGSPGAAGSGPVLDVVVNEVLAQPFSGEPDAIELYNRSGGEIDIGGWLLSDSNNDYGKFQIPTDDPQGRDSIPADGYVVFDQNDFGFGLRGNAGDDVWLLEADAAGKPLRFVDHVEFDGAPFGVSVGRWPNGSGDGKLELMSDVTLGSANVEPLVKTIIINEIHADPDVKTEPVEFVELYNYGTNTVDMSGWLITGGIDFTFDANTELGPDEYLVVAQDPAALLAKYGVASLGPYTGQLANEGNRVVLRNAMGVKQDEVDYGLGFPWPTTGAPPGYSIELINPQFDNDLGGNWLSSTGLQGGNPGPTPGGLNSVYSTNAAPQMRQVEHSPQQPASDQPVTITVKVTDPEGVASVVLSYQLVDPGDYIKLDDPRYATEWTAVPMNDSGTGGDAQSGDDVFTALLPGTLQTHRRLVRYRITAEDTLGEAITAPYADDPQPNFAYFVYDGVPDWTGSAQPGVEPDVTYSSDLLTSVPVYHFITQRQDHLEALTVPYRYGQPDQQLPSGNNTYYRGQEYLWQGTLVYDGEVYDHVNYRARGGVWRYSMGKNMWKFDFLRGHQFQAHDDYGNDYFTTWDKLNLSAIIQQGNFQQRGEQGLFESVGFKLHDLTGNAAPKTNFIHFRLVEGEDENGPDQFSGDFQGVYLAVEQPDGNFLDEHGLPDGNLYKMEGGTGTLNNQGPTQPTDRSDLNAFMAGYQSNPGQQWFEDNIDLEDYYSFRAIAMAVHDYDIHAGKNYFYYHDPVTDKWKVFNWDLDLTWTTTYNGGGGKGPLNQYVLAVPELRIEYNNRLREIVDLLFNPEQTGILIDEMARVVYTPGEPSLVDADAAMWDYNPILTSSYINSSKAGHGRFYQNSPTDDFAGMIQIIKNYVGNKMNAVDPQVASDEGQQPNTPTISYTGPAGYPVDDLSFETSAFGGGSGNFAAMQWRIARVTNPNSPDFDPTAERHYEITATWESDELSTFDAATSIPGEVLVIGATYRARVRMKDDAGRWSHWSAPEQFVAGDALDPTPEALRITEIMYRPLAPTPTELAVDPAFTTDDFEYIEFTNTGAVPLDLNGVRFTNGVTFDFTGSNATSLAPDAHVLVVNNTAAFEARYGTGLTIAGEYGDNDFNAFDDADTLDDGGERIRLIDAYERVVLDFTYDNADPWPDRADGLGSSLEIIDPAGSYDDTANWHGSTEYQGSPGEAGVGPTTTIVVNEILTHTDDPQTDAIELYNAGDTTVDIAGWWLSDSSDDYQKFEIPVLDLGGAGKTELAPGEFIVFYEGHWVGPAGNRELMFNQTTEFGGTGPKDFALSGAHGDEVWLLAADAAGNLTHFVDQGEFGAAANGESFGRWPDEHGVLYPMTSWTPGAANSGPRVGPLVISEVMYHPTPPTAGDLAIYPALTEDDLEYVEIYNPTDNAVDLTNWRLRRGVDFDFADGTIIPKGEAIVVLPFDPDKQDDQGQFVNADRTNAFRHHYGMAAAFTLVGGYSGRLNDDGELVRLQRPDEPPVEEPTFIPRLLEDEVPYRDVSPWPTEPDGGGQSLTRSQPAAWGHAAASWSAASPTPGHTFEGPLTVDNVAPTPSGFVVRFNRPLETAGLNLYDGVAGAFGPSDVTLVGSAVGSVAGSLFLRDDTLTFVASGGPLEADTYTLTLRSAADGLRDQIGQLLDGDHDGIPGGDFVHAFETAAQLVHVGLPDFARAAGQAVQVPASGPGLPLTLTDDRAGGDGITSVELTITYDPALLDITSAALGPDAPAGASVAADTNTPGRIVVTFNSNATSLANGTSHFVTLAALVTGGAEYGTVHVVELSGLSVNSGAIPATADAAVHAVAYFGDATGNGAYSGLDAQRVARIGVGLDTGFDDFPITDPVIIADITGNGALSGLDAQRIAQRAAGLNPDEFPPLPGPQRLNQITQPQAGGSDAVAAGERLDSAPAPALKGRHSWWERIPWNGPAHPQIFLARIYSIPHYPVPDPYHTLRIPTSTEDKSFDDISDFGVDFDGRDLIPAVIDKFFAAIG